VLVTPILAFYCPEGSVWAAPIFLLGTNLQFACYFGLAVFCALCVGNRFAQGLLYGIVNFGSIIAGWLINTIFVPMYYGIRINTDPFQLFSPIVFMANAPFAYVERIYRTEHLNISDLIGVALHPDDGIIYYFLGAALGIGLLFAAMALYRRRKLECAGDFLAIKGIEPVFLVVYSVILGAVFHFFVNEVIGMETFAFLFIGLAVGWFTGKMLLERTPRVFRKKNLLRCGILLAVSGLTIVAALLDPFGIENWVPRADKVASVSISDGSYRYPQNTVTMERKEDIAHIIAIHQAALEEHHQGYPHGYTFETAGRFWDMTLKMYLGTQDEAFCTSVAEKAMIIGYTRMLRRAIRRPDHPRSPARVARCKEMLAILLEKVDDLAF
jgi:ABC-2 type transport system permease protein